MYENKLSYMITANFNKTSKRSLVPALDRGIDILELLAKEKKGLSFAEIVEKLNLPTASLSRILLTLQKRKLIEKDRNLGLYRLGINLFIIGSSLLDRMDLRDCAHDQMQVLLGKTNETIELCIPDGDAILWIDKLDSIEPIGIKARVGYRSKNLHCNALGKAMLAYGGNELLEEMVKGKRLIKKTKNTIVNLNRLKQVLKEIMDVGYAYDCGEVRDNITRFASPIFDHNGKNVGIIGIAGPSFRLPMKKKRYFGEIVSNVAKNISKNMGFIGNVQQ